MKYLVIDLTKQQPFRGVVEAGGGSTGTTALLGADEVPRYSAWVGLHMGRRLLDKFELQLLADGALKKPVQPRNPPHIEDAAGCKFEPTDLYYEGDEPRVVWTPQLVCDDCEGAGHHAEDGDPTFDDECQLCGGAGVIDGEEFTTDIDGWNVQPEEH